MIRQAPEAVAPTRFRWERRGDALALRAETRGAVGAFTTRVGGVCPPPYDSLNVSYARGHGTRPDWGELVTENRRICSSFIGGNPYWTRVQAVHGVDVVEAAHRHEDIPREGVNMANPAADGLWTADPRRTIAAQGSDCCPILFVGDSRIAVVHAGWRGHLNGIVQTAAQLVSAREVFVGPGIGPCCYGHAAEVCGAFVDRFGAGVVREDGRLDLWEVARRAAAEAGVADVYLSRLCTFCNPALFFSSRRDGALTGGQAAIARLP